MVLVYGLIGTLLILAFSRAVLPAGIAFQAPSRLSPDGWIVLAVESYAPMERCWMPAISSSWRPSRAIGRKSASVCWRERRKTVSTNTWVSRAGFQSTDYFAKLMLVHSAQDRPELARAFVRQQNPFYWRLWRYSARLRFIRSVGRRWTCRNSCTRLERMRDQIGAGALPPAAGATFNPEPLVGNVCAAQPLQKILRLLREANCFSASLKSRVWTQRRAPRCSTGKPQVEHFVEEHKLHGHARNPGVVQQLAENNGVMRRIVVAPAIRGTACGSNRAAGAP